MKAGKIDANQPEIVKELREKGYFVFSIANLKNCCDLIVEKNGITRLIEVKNPEYCSNIEYMSQEERERFFTVGEKKFAEDFSVFICISAKEVIDLFL